jgi:hypothetical protein
MFSYYGSKSKIIKSYPIPKYDTIIEPFAGSSRYALRFYDKKCWINDSYKVIYDVWNWIIQASIMDLDKIPNIKPGEDIRNYNLPIELEYLLGFAVNYSTPFPHYIYTKWASRDNEVLRLKHRLSCYIGKLNHWKITNSSYIDIPNIEATWFIDPPYQFGGKYYIHNTIDYQELSEWCLSRKGQIIVCENSKATWLPFKPLKELHGQRYKTMEMIYTND